MIQKILSLSYPRIVTLEYRLRQGIATLEWLPSLLPVGDSSADHHPRLRRLHVDESQLTILLQGTVAVQIAPCLNEAPRPRTNPAAPAKTQPE